MSDPVPAITEAAATGEIAAVFANIRRVLGVEVVKLIWRHLATIPSALPWAWGILRPLYVDGTIAVEAAALHDDLDLPPLPQFPPEVLAAYDRTNAMAIVALSGLLRHIEDEPPTIETAPLYDVDVSDESRPLIPLP